MRSVSPGSPLTLGEGVTCPLPGPCLPLSSRSSSRSVATAALPDVSITLHHAPAQSPSAPPPSSGDTQPLTVPCFRLTSPTQTLCPAAQNGTLVPGHPWPSPFAHPLPSAGSRVPLSSW